MGCTPSRVRETPLGANFPAQSMQQASESTAEVKLKAAVLVTQRLARGFLGRWAERHRLSFELAHALECIEEAEGVRLSEFLSRVYESSGPHQDVPEDSPLVAPEAQRSPVVAPEAQRKRSQHGPEEMRLSWPLTEVAVLRLLEGFCRGEQLARADVHRLIEAEAAFLGGLPNVVDAKIEASTPLAVVGDLHGQLADLVHLFRCVGFPSAERPFLFNGDFVDRGELGIEIVLTLFAFHRLLPEHVFLNRGNHEESSVCGCHGFRQECVRKYDEATYRLFLHAFAQLPLATRAGRSSSFRPAPNLRPPLCCAE